MSELLALQQLFAHLAADFLRRLDALGYAYTFGDAYRDDRCAYGMPTSLHKSRLALDVNLFRAGEYLTTVEQWREAGELWETLHPLCRWGGRFAGASAGDANHISLTYQGRA